MQPRHQDHASGSLGLKKETWAHTPIVSNQVVGIPQLDWTNSKAWRSLSLTRVFRVLVPAACFALATIAFGEAVAAEGLPGHHLALNEDPADTEALLAAGAELAARLNDDVVETDIGFRVTQACYDKWRPGEFNRILHGAVREGTRCLLDLQETGKGHAPNGVTNALRNGLALEALRQRSTVSLACDEDEFDWEREGVKGRATTTRDNPRHPFIGLNPKFPLSDRADSKKREREIEQITALLFHEHLHNIGHAHGEDIEYSSACGDCCFYNEQIEFFYPEAKLLACQICTGNYRDRDDPRFLKDLLDYASAYDMHSAMPEHFTRRARAEVGDAEALLMLSRAQALLSSPVGPALAQEVQSKYQGALSPYALETLGDVEKKKTPALPDEIGALAESVAEAYWLLYGVHDSISTLDVLLNRKVELLSLTEGQADYPVPVQRAVDALKRDVQDLLDELSLNRFQDRLYPPAEKTTSEVAEELHRLLFPDDA